MVVRGAEAVNYNHRATVPPPRGRGRVKAGTRRHRPVTCGTDLGYKTPPPQRPGVPNRHAERQ